MRNHRWVVAASLVFAFVSLPMQAVLAHSETPSMVTWTVGQKLTYTDLNDAFSHVHNTLSGGLSNTNLSSSAAIAHSKMATPGVLPKSFLYVGTPCTVNGVCAETVDQGATSVTTRTATGTYDIIWSSVRTNAAYGLLVVGHGVGNFICSQQDTANVAGFRVNCFTADTGVAADAPFTVVMFDDNN